MKKILMLAVASAVFAGAFALPAHASSLTWDSFVIRNANGTGDVPSISSTGNDVTTSIIEAGQKTGFGTSGVDGLKIGSLVSLSYDRLDAGTGTPYLNIWVTNGTYTALIAPVAGANAGGGYASEDINGLSLQTLGFNIYDNSDGANYDWLYTGAKIDAGPNSLLTSTGQVITLADIANLTITAPVTTTDTGAPEHLNDGLNIIFGDTQGNFTSPIPYELNNVQLITAVPLPSAASMGLGMLGLIGAAGMLRKKFRAA